MFFPEGQIRVHLYGQPCDMRNYVNIAIMLIGTVITVTRPFSFNSLRS